MSLGSAAFAQQSSTVPNAPNAIPDAPTPQAGSSLGDLKDQVKPGASTTAAPSPDAVQAARPGVNQAAGSNSSSSASGGGDPETGENQVTSTDSTPNQTEAPELPAPGQGAKSNLIVSVNEVVVPVTVRDKKRNLVPSLDWRKFRVFEDGVRQRIVYFTTDPFPLSVAFVIDQSLPADVMNRVNESLSAVSGAFTPSDAVAVFGYNSTTRMITDFTGAQGARLNVALTQAKAPGRDMGVIAPGGPMDNGIVINNKQMDPNTSPEHGLNVGFAITPKEYHPLNDAILAAATELAKQPRDRRKILYIISDGKEQGSKASYKEVVRFLLGNNISVDGTLVGDSAIWGLGTLDRYHLPLLPTMKDNALPKYVLATGGTLDSQVSENGIQMSFAKITNSVRNQYTLIYNSHASTLANRFHTIEVRVEGIPGLDIVAPDGYYPQAHPSNNSR
ncbi:VWA domain-containing protein [Acidipila sp. EB88]|uniref:VWA domain-containing protein n=1 Tax=Acidipila sp. EB88 TaxID=2305226 RepID=UPI001315A6BC|nr:VWA domain-containing protein [Acidipila sp. EB88]